QKYSDKNRGKIQEKDRVYYHNIKKHLKDYKIKAKDKNLRYKFKITLEEYNFLFIKQNGLCKICNKSEIVKRNGKIKNLAVDHCHKTGKVRGLLCQSCNIMIGNSQDNINLLKFVIVYLEENFE